MNPNTLLAINNPCHESWHQMTPNQQGRFCTSCQKTVTDFTQMSDQEVLNWLSRHNESVCGRLREDQVQRPLIATAAKKPGHSRYWHYLIALLLSPTEVAAQSHRAKPAPHHHVPADAHPLNISPVGSEPAHLEISQIKRDDNSLAYPVQQTLTGYLGAVSVVRYKKKRPVADTLAAIKDTLVYCLSYTQKDLTVYPNPVSRGNVITIAAKLTTPGTFSVQLFNISGGLQQSLTADREQLSGNLSMTIPGALPPGTYVVRLSHPELKRAYTQTIVVF